MRVELILDLISKTVRHKITNQEGTTSVGTPLVRYVDLILKLIMNKKTIDTKATSSAFRSYIKNLDSFMSSFS